ncbi:MAG: hypothetical protein Q8T08_08435, partial [Ignavibacteria bacterium]|nr:hypothetical protein [Ignavibacteria bacterium]
MNHLKRIITFLFCFLFLTGYSQNEFVFSENPEKFITQVDSILKQIPSKRYLELTETLMPSLIERWNSQRFSKTEKNLIMSVAAKMQQQKMRNHPQLYNYFEMIGLLAQSTQKAQSVLAWNNYLLVLLNKDDVREFESIIAQTATLLVEGRIVSRGTTNWYLRKAKYEFFSDTSLVLKVDQADLVCATSRDSSVIMKTEGLFEFKSQLWKGSGGKVIWWRFEFDGETPYVEFSNYTIDLSRSSYSADSVVFHHKSY